MQQENAQAKDDINPELLLAQDQGRFFDDPMGWVMYSFPWDTDQSIQQVKLQEPWRSRYNCEYGPDVWACELLDDWGKHIKEQGFDATGPVMPYRDATSSGHGIGKSAITSWIILFIMSTRPFCSGTVTAGNATQLRTKTWGELGKWKAKCLTGHWFIYNNGKSNMNLYHAEHPENWRTDGYTCKEENADAFAGQHAANSSSFYIFDEASAVPKGIWTVADGGMTDGEPFWFAFGNPTQNTGEFRECFRKNRKRWNTRNIDSRDVQITNKRDLAEKIEHHGIDSDYVKVRIRGVFPSQSVKQFIAESLVDAAEGRHLKITQYNFAPVIITCDPAWEGDDVLTIGKRQGLHFVILDKIPKNDNDILIANKIARYEDEFKADAVFIDGGYGTGIKSAGTTMGREWTLVWFSEASNDEGCLNKRAEMYNLARTWLAQGGAIPEDEDLHGDLTGIETVPRLDGKIQLESKNDMKKRGLPSTDCSDCFVLSFAHPVVKEIHIPGADYETGRAATDYDPISRG